MKYSIIRIATMSLVALGSAGVLLIALLTKEITLLGYYLLAGLAILLALNIVLDEVRNMLKNKRK